MKWKENGQIDLTEKVRRIDEQTKRLERLIQCDGKKVRSYHKHEEEKSICLTTCFRVQLFQA